MQTTLTDLRLAVLIDADNVPYSNVKGMLTEIAKYGTPTFKRIYGDWTKPTVVGWKNVLLENAITPIQQYSYTTGKNATDSAMIIDAMDILYSGRVDGFCLVTSDSDFTKLAIRLREAGMKVIGIGERKTPNPFIVACNMFIYLEILEEDNEKPEPEEPNVTKTNTTQKKQKPKGNTLKKADTKLVSLISTSVDDLGDENGWAFLGEVGALIIKKQPDFDPRVYGFKKLSTLIRSLKQFEIDVRDTGKLHVKHIYVRNKAETVKE